MNYLLSSQSMLQPVLRIMITILLMSVTFIAPRAESKDASDQGHLIRGIVQIPPELSTHFSSGDRLIIKLYYPDDGIEKDQTFRIFNNAKFPFQFKVGPGLDMSRRTKWDAYIIEAFIDKDKDVLSHVAGELFATTTDLIPIGTEGVELILREMR